MDRSLPGRGGSQGWHRLASKPWARPQPGLERVQVRDHAAVDAEGVGHEAGAAGTGERQHGVAPVSLLDFARLVGPRAQAPGRASILGCRAWLPEGRPPSAVLFGATEPREPA